MKLSLSWIFEHINSDWKKLNPADIVKKINTSTAEIESFNKIEINLNSLELAKVQQVNDKTTLTLVNAQKEIALNSRTDIQPQDIVLLKKTGNEYRWVTLQDIGGTKESLLAPLTIAEEYLKNNKWYELIETTDYILELDNKSITNRPDLWSHRGFAREIAAIFDLKLKELNSFLSTTPVISERQEYVDKDLPLKIKIENLESCKKFAAFYISEIKIKNSDMAMAFKLAKVDSKPINFIVDCTNYVMFDLGQPMHAFDAGKISSNIAVPGEALREAWGPRFAKQGEKLTLLDNETVELTNKDLVIADSNKALALAGIMGGNNSEIQKNSSSILIESACFDPATIRKTSVYVKKRTDSSARFEKNLDPKQNVYALQRFLNLIHYHGDGKIISLGMEPKEITISLSHKFIESRLGAKIESSFIVNTLSKMEFKVESKNGEYIITVPSFRATKDILIKEDIVEEIGRFFGYNNIPFVLPSKQIKPFDLEHIRRTRKIKQYLAFGASMHEVQNYPFYDEQFLKELGWEPSNYTHALNPVSENWQRLVDSLIPHLIKNVQQNLNALHELRFFEINKIWNSTSKENVIESKNLAGIFFDKKNEINFYNCKAYLNQLFESLGFDIQWTKADKENLKIWYNPYQTAKLMYENKEIGYAGIANINMLSKITEGHAFIFELDADLLINGKVQAKKYIPLSKYQPVWLDISMLVALNVTVDQVTNIIKNSDNKIYSVELVDLFENPKWNNQKSMTLRYHLVDHTKTLLKEEINEVMSKVNNNIKNIGAEIR